MMAIQNHFEWLDPGDTAVGAKLYDYPDLFREAADALRLKSFYHEALRYYKPLQHVVGYMDSSCHLEMASCYRYIGLKAEAENCYKTIMTYDYNSVEARSQLAVIRREPDFSYTNHKESTDTNKIGTVSKHKARRRAGTRNVNHIRSSKISSTSAVTMLVPCLVTQPVREFSLEREQMQEEEIHMLFLRRQTLMNKLKGTDGHTTAQWMAASKALVKTFSNNKIFYPFDKHHKFYGYSKEARILASKPKYEQDAVIGQLKLSSGKLDSGKKMALWKCDPLIRISGRQDQDPIIVPDDYCGVPFSAWLDTFLEYALALAKSGDIKSAYDTIASAFHANVFFHSPEALFLIHVCWFSKSLNSIFCLTLIIKACALTVSDEETLCNIARWFMKEYQFATDGYRLFAALNRVCDSDNPWYNCGPSQKHLLRQLKAVDFSLLGKARCKRLFQERASYSTTDGDGNRIHAEDMDVALLTLYGHVLYAGKSYAFAVSKSAVMDDGSESEPWTLADE